MSNDPLPADRERDHGDEDPTSEGSHTPSGSQGIGPQGDDPQGDDPQDGEPQDDDPQDDDPRASGSHVPATVARGMAPPPPPRRTGVFVDVDDLREHVGGLLRSILGGHEVDAFGNFTFTHENARVFVTVATSPIGPQIGVFSVTNVDIDLDPDLAGFLLTTNHRLGFGAFSYDPKNRAVWLRHTLLGTTIDLPELQSAVAAIATTAAGLDERIRDRFGGRTFQEAPDDVQQRMEPPAPESGGGSASAGGYL